jgi:2-polyprenyl-3-methyl-5-hydroxy-6-metoxy-1,4-benzoquinol methylase
LNNKIETKHQEDQIRPNSFEDEYRDVLLKEIKAYFFEAGTGRLKADKMRTVRCPACNEDRHQPFMEKDGFALKSCPNCDLIFVNPRPSETAQIEFFSQSKAIGLYSEMVEMTKAARAQLIFEPLVDYIFNRYGLQGGSLLEIGCGSGLLLEALAAKKSGWALRGVEPSDRAVAICRKKGLNVLHGSLEHLAEDEAYDLVVFWAVFDHFFDPFSIIEKSHRLLKAGGSILIGNMNIDGFESSVLGTDNPAFAPPERQNFFGIKSMEAMLKRGGFADIQIRTTGKLDVDIVKNYWLSGKTHERTKFLDKIVFGSEAVQSAFQSFLSQNRLAGHMTVTAVKPA